MYEHGLGVIQDHAVAASAERGEPQAQYNLADLYLRAEGVPHDEGHCLRTVPKSHSSGPHARTHHARLHMRPRPRHAERFASAYLWISGAALQGNTRRSATLPSLETQLTPAELADASLGAQSLAFGFVPSRNVALLH